MSKEKEEKRCILCDCLIDDDGYCTNEACENSECLQD